jgi:hypothetical protein
MNDIVAAHADTAIHVILDNLNTPQAQERSLAQTSSECAFPLHADAGPPDLTRSKSGSRSCKETRGASFTSVAQLREHIDAFIETYNQHAKPFVWTKARGPSKTHQSPFRGTVIQGTSASMKWRN